LEEPYEYTALLIDYRPLLTEGKKKKDRQGNAVIRPKNPELLRVFFDEMVEHFF